MPSYNKLIVASFFEEQGLTIPEFEYKFHPDRKWRFDIAWPSKLLAIEAQGGIFKMGRHNRGAALLKEYEKLNSAAAMGWRILFFQPSDLCLMDTARVVHDCMYPPLYPPAYG